MTISRDKHVLVKLFVPENDQRLDVIKFESEPIEFVYKPVSSLLNKTNDNYLNPFEGIQWPTTSFNTNLLSTSKLPFAAFNFNHNYNHDGDLDYDEITDPMSAEKMRKSSWKENSNV